jgi:hypothetical protein
MNRVGSSLLIAFATFIVTYVALMGYAMISFAYFSGPIPSLLYGLILPFLIGAFVGMVAFRVKGSN